MVHTSLSIPSTNKPSYGINKVLAYVEPYLREIKPDIAGFHIFEADNTKYSANVQETSVIFVANTELARQKGVHFNIPGELMNVFFVDGKNEEGKIKFKADSVIKPLTIVVSDYVLHVNICYDMPSKPQIKTVGTQTKKRYVLSSSVDDSKPIYTIESYLLSDSRVKHEQKFTQTDNRVLMKESQLFSQNLHKHYQSKSVQTVYFKELISYSYIISNSSSDKTYYFRDKSDVNLDEGTSKSDSFEYSSKQTIDPENSSSSFTSYDSHAHMNQTAVLNHVKDKEMYKTASIESKQTIKEPTSTDRKKEKETLTLFNNASNYNIKTKISDDAFKNVEPTFFSKSTVLSQTRIFEEDRSETFVKTEDYNNDTTQVKNFKSSSNVSLVDIKELLNKTTISLKKLYSVVELLEKKSVKRSSSTTAVQTAGYTGGEQHKNKTDVPRQTSTFIKSQATLEESISTNCSDQSRASVELQEARSRSNQSNMTSYEKSLKGYKDASSLDIFCERCGSFHTNYFGFAIECKKFCDKNMKLLENDEATLDAINSGLPMNWDFLSKNDESESVIAIIQDEMQRCGSNDHFSNAMQSSLETNSKDSTMSCKEPNYLTMNESSQRNKPNKFNETQLLDNGKDDQGNGAAHKIPENCNKRLVDRECNKNLHETKNHSASDNVKLSQETLINRREFELDEIPTFGHNLANFDGAFKAGNSNSQRLRGIKTRSNNTISSNENCSLEEYIETEKTVACDSSTQNLTSFHCTFKVNNNNPSNNSILSNQNIEHMGDSKAIDEYNSAQNIKVSNTLFLLSQPNNSISTKSEQFSKATTSLDENQTKANSQVFYFTEVRNTKSWIGFKKSLQSCHFNKKLGLIGKVKITNSAPTTNQLKIKNLSSGDHLHGNIISKISSSCQEKLNIFRLFSNKANFLNNKYSSSSTLHIIPSHELQKQNNQESNFQDRELSKNALRKVGNKSPTLKNRPQGNCNKREHENSACISFENKLELNNPNLIKTHNDSKTTKNITQNKITKNKKQKKSKLFCFFI